MKESKKTVEENAGEVILQSKIDVYVRGQRYEVDQPSLATLILASKFISKLPKIKMEGKNILQETFAQVEGTEVLADIVCVFLIGAKEYNKRRMWWEFWNRKKSREYIRKKLLEEWSVGDLFTISLQIFQGLQIEGFFGLTTFLTGINLLKETRGVGSETTVSGQ